MNIAHLAILCCPETGEELELVKVESNHTYGFEEITTGFLISKHKHILYPILRGIPRMFSGAAVIFKNEMAPYLSQVTQEYIMPEPDEEFTRFFLPTQRSFSKEWLSHNLKKDTWGWDQPQRLKKFLEYLDIPPGDYQGKYFLDLGAGSGQLTTTVAKAMKGTFIGLDLSFGIERGEALKHEIGAAENCSFVQGNLMHQPFKKESFDFVLSSGVMHHTPDTKKAFMASVGVVKRGGKLATWLYNHTDFRLPLLPFVKSKRFSIHEDTLRKYSTKMNVGVLYGLTKAYSVVFHVIYSAGALVRGKKHPQNITGRTLSIFDRLSPKYVWQHGEEEVKEWFREAGFSHLVLSDMDNTSGWCTVGVRN